MTPAEYSLSYGPIDGGVRKNGHGPSQGARVGKPLAMGRWHLQPAVRGHDRCFPPPPFDLTGIARVNYPEIWQCVGMIVGVIVGVYGIGYLVAASDPRRHWPIVLVGLLG